MEASKIKLSPREAVKVYQVSRATLTKALKSGKVKAQKTTDGHWKIDTEELNRVYMPRVQVNQMQKMKSEYLYCASEEITKPRASVSLGYAFEGATKKGKTMETGTIKELNLKPGDVVECITHHYTDYDVFIPGKDYTVDQEGMFTSEHGNTLKGNCAVWRIVSRASDDTPKLWRDMTDAEKGALLLAHHEGKVIEYFATLCREWRLPQRGGPYWFDVNAYRVKPEPVRETVTLTSWGTCYQWQRDGDLSRVHNSHGKYRITFDRVDGKPDPDSIKMETIK